MNIDGYALIIGGGSGIGKACALQFVKEGAAGVMIADINLHAANDVVDHCKAVSAGGKNPGLRAEAIYIDVTSETSVSRTMAHMVDTFGRIDYCVNNAGIGVQNANEMADADAVEFNRFLSVNVTGAFHVMREVSGIMKTQEPRMADAECPDRGTYRGAIVNMGSLASFVAQPGMVQYTASKHAVLGLSKNAALDNAAYGIRVNTVCPSWVDTPMLQRAIDQVPGLEQMIKTIVPFGRIARPEEVADAVMFLCSPRSSYVTGCSFVIDGGTALRGIL